MTMRRFVLWLTGRDLLAPKQVVRQYAITNPHYTFAVNIGGTEGLRISSLRGPNVLHRLTQRIVLGFKWEMLP